VSKTDHNHIYKDVEEALHPIFGKISSMKIYDYQRFLFSEIFKAKCFHNQGERNIVIKKYTEETRSYDTLRFSLEKEYHTLLFLYDKFKAFQGLSVVRPITILPEKNILITEHFDGKKLNELIIKDARWLPLKPQIERLQFILFQAGKWLRTFQEFTKKQTSVLFQKIDYSEKIQKRLELFWQYGLEKSYKKKINDFINKTIKEANGTSLEIVGYHGDFTPGNILVTDSEIGVLDLDRFDFRPKYDDLTIFLAALEGNKSILGMQKKYINILVKSFLHGYGIDQINLNLFNIYIFLNTLKKLSNIDLNQHSNIKTLDIIYEKLRKKRLINVYLRYILDGIEAKNFLISG
jgi:hypothetical protein